MKITREMGLRLKIVAAARYRPDDNPLSTPYNQRSVNPPYYDRKEALYRPPSSLALPPTVSRSNRLARLFSSSRPESISQLKILLTSLLLRAPAPRSMVCRPNLPVVPRPL